MTRWADNAITITPKVEAPKTSWWITADVQANHAAFSKRLITEELDRMRQNDRFGGAKKVHSDG